MRRSSLDTSVIHVLGQLIKAVFVAAVLGVICYGCWDVYLHVTSITAECTAKVEAEFRQALDLLGGFCRTHPNDLNGICAKAHDTVHLHDSTHAIRDCRMTQMLDHPFFSSDTLKAFLSYTTHGVAALALLVFVFLLLLAKLGVSVMDMRKVWSDYNHSKSVELPTVVDSKHTPGSDILRKVSYKTD